MLSLFSCKKEECDLDSIPLSGFLIIINNVNNKCNFNYVYECNMHGGKNKYKVLLYTNTQYMLATSKNELKDHEVLTFY